MEEDKLNYYFYFKNELNKIDSFGTSLIKERLSKIDVDNIKDTDIKDICKYIDFLNISESIRIYYFHEWYKHIKI